jgi:hypothetical protein
MDKDTMLCPNCPAEIAPEAKICSNCGYSVGKAGKGACWAFIVFCVGLPLTIIAAFYGSVSRGLGYRTTPASPILVGFAVLGGFTLVGVMIYFIVRLFDSRRK